MAGNLIAEVSGLPHMKLATCRHIAGLLYGPLATPPPFIGLALGGAGGVMEISFAA